MKEKLHLLLFAVWALSITIPAKVRFDPEIPQIAFAAGKIAEAFEGDAVAVFLEVEDEGNNQHPESFRIERMKDGGIRIIGSDAAGAMYGGLEVAELLRIGGPTMVQNHEATPALGMRGVKFNIPLDVRTPSYSDMGDAGQHAMEDIWDLAFWKEFIDELAQHRYNYISLWNLHPFPSLIEVPKYPEVALADVKRSTTVYGKIFSTNAVNYDDPEVLAKTEVLKEMTIGEKVNFWREVMSYGKSRNVDFYFVTWNIYAYGTEGKYGIDNSIHNEATIDYFRESVKTLFLSYPDLRGIGLTTGEDMHGASQEEKEKWAFQTYGQGVLDVLKEQPGRQITFLHRQHQTGALEIAKHFEPLIEHPDIDFIFSFKYAKAHVYSATRQPYHEAFVEEISNRGELKTIWTMRNDSVYLYRWAAPKFVREFVQNIPSEVSRGYYFGSDGWVWARDFVSQDPADHDDLEFKKHWFQWLLWGRLAYDPQISDDRFLAILQARFPSVDAQALMTAWEASSAVYPLTTGFHWGALDFQWYIEGCKSMPGKMGLENGFHDVDYFIKLGTHPRSGYTGIRDYVQILARGESFAGTGPFEISAQLHEKASLALHHLKTLKATPGTELAKTLADIQTVAYLGHYYGHKISGAAHLHTFREIGGEDHQEAAIQELTKAARYWRLYTGSSKQHYKNPIWYNRVNMVDWDELTKWVEHDIVIAKEATTSASTATDPQSP